MADRISSDHPSVRTIRATCAETTTGVRLEVPPDDHDAVPLEDVIRVVVDGDKLFARVERAMTGEGRWIRGVYETPDAARDPSGATDRLSSWVAESDVRVGGSVLVDVVEPDFLYGLREPGSTVYYDATEPPNEGLQDIARSLENDEDR
ncbi:DUF7112 family protein [Halopiger goleimassiliensis]|uniref:DUF7112 family protein n=1 Tax=Halopiger goleimassiliensis TaxID=1293048 RepID=UPI000677D873|nr:hypothetical protein [Halopiger goleimassiliensis]